MTYYSTSTAYDGSRIKAEPKDDDIDMLDAPPARPQLKPMNPYYPSSAEASSRAKDSTGKPSSTICFHQVHLGHPHHHFLRCGHDIMTRNVEQCGSNCMLSDKAETKPSGKAFECPHPTCVRQRAAFRQKTVGRRCQLSHVYGRDLDADAARRQEKAKYEATDRVSLQEKVLKLKRSPSPKPSAAHRPERPTRSRKAERIAENRRVITEIKLERNVTRLTRLDFDDREKIGNHGEISLPYSDVRTETYDGYKCNCCDSKIEVVRYRCGECEDKHKQEVDLCAKCYVYRSAQVWSRQPQHHLHDHKFLQINIGAYEARERLEEMRRGPGDQDKDFEILETYCVCESRSLEHMTECEKCDKPFHIGCAGEGKFDPDRYLTMEDVETWHEEDLQAFRNRHTDLPFLCMGCKSGDYDEEAAEQSRKKNLDDLAILRRANARQQNQVRSKKRRADESIDVHSPNMEELFGEEDIQKVAEERPAKCAKTGHDVPTFGQWTMPVRESRKGIETR